jgi:hypothetical protein
MPNVSANYPIQPSRTTRFAAQNSLSAYKLDGTPEEQPSSVENEELQSGMAEFIKKQFRRAQDHKRAIGIEERLLRNLSAYKCEYTAEEMKLLDTGTEVYIGICSLKARAAQSWLRDIILNNIEKPWTIDDTPIPDLPETAKEQVLDMLVGELQGLTTIEDIRERAKELKNVALDQAKELAEKAVRKMETVIEDQLEDNGFHATFSSCIEDITVYPSVFVRGPYNSSKKIASWKGNKFGAETKTIPDCRVINPFDAYPSPSSTTAKDGEFFIERARLQPSTLYDSINVAGFDEVNIRRALSKYCDGYSLDLTMDAARDKLEEVDQGTTTKSTTVDTLIYNGLVPGKWLIEHKVLVKDPQKHYEAEVWLAGDYVIKATLNPDITDTRPIHSTSYIKTNRNIWGQSVIDLVYDTQRVCLASVRSLVRNMAFASGPFGEADASRLADGQDPRDITPLKIFLVTPDLTGASQGPVFRFEKIDSIANELISVFERFMKVADDLSGVPAYVLGNPQVAGAGRTMGGLSMLMGNAAKGIKNVQLNIDKDIISTLITGFYVYNMITSDDVSIKADAKVTARGATGLLQRELSQARLVEILNTLGPFIPIWDKMPDGLKILLREILKQTGLPVDDIIADPKAKQVLLDKVRELGQAESFFRGTSNPVPLPTQSQYPGAENNLPPEAANVNTNPTPLAMAGPA